MLLNAITFVLCFFFSSRRRHTRSLRDWSSDVCSSDLSLDSSCRKLDFRFDLVVTAERVGAYKPDFTHFHTAIADLAATGIARARILHVGQSLRADITPANRLGLKCAWINRPGRLLGLSGEGAAEARPDLTVSSLQEFVTAITANNRAVA